MNRIWAAKIAVTVVAALVSVWVYFASDAQFDALLHLLPAMRSTSLCSSSGWLQSSCLA